MQQAMIRPKTELTAKIANIKSAHMQKYLNFVNPGEVTQVTNGVNLAR